MHSGVRCWEIGVILYLGQEQAMHSICCVVLPDDLILSKDSVYDFVKTQIHKYYSELEVEPYKKFYSDKEALWIAKNYGYDNIVDFENSLNTKTDEGIENGRYYRISTCNTQGRWDGFTVLEIKKICDLENGFLPYSVVASDGAWYSERDYGNVPLLDFEHGGCHPNNAEPRKKWMDFWNCFSNEHRNKYLAILDVHS